MANKESKKEESLKPQDLELFKETLDVLIARGENRELARKFLKTLQDPNFKGVSTDHIAASQRVLKDFMHKPYQFQEDLTELTQVIHHESRFAYFNWQTRKDKAAATLKRTIKTTVTTAVLLGMAVGGYEGFDQFNKSYNSPEAIAQRAQEAAEKQYIAQIQAEEKQRQAQQAIEKAQEAQLSVEQKMTLGSEWSATSSYNWKIKYLPKDPERTYVDAVGDEVSKIVALNKVINIGRWLDDSVRLGIDGDLRMYANTYKKLDGTLVPKFTINTPSQQLNVDVLLRVDDDPFLDTKVVYAFDTGLGRERYFMVSIVEPSKEALAIKSVIPTKKG